jgi:hypothetical protein
MAVALVDRLAILAAVRRFPSMGADDSRSLRSESYVRRTTKIPFRGFLGDVRREFMQHLYTALHGTLGSYLRDAFQEGSSNVVACFRVPRALVFPSFVLFAWWLACFPLLPPLSLSFPSAINFSPHYIS